MNPRGLSIQRFAYVEPEQKSQFDVEMDNAKQYFGDYDPGSENLTCQKCGAAVNLGWTHVDWHEGRTA
jgi:hypothetical protein